MEYVKEITPQSKTSPYQFVCPFCGSGEGHNGTGALKQAVRDFLKTSPYVAKFRPGEDSEGGDGVCVVDIN